MFCLLNDIDIFGCEKERDFLFLFVWKLIYVYKRVKWAWALSYIILKQKYR